jgi:antitoxin (DNA-binding transcriptional repressor) of toxin-antitoxin stability system
MQISLTDLRRTPAAALDHVRSGEEVIVTEEGVPFMRMVPTNRSSRYDELIAAGVIHPPKAPRDIDDIRAASLARWGTPEE